MSNSKMDEHIHNARVENIRFLLGPCQMHHDLVARRLGMTPATLQRFIERYPDAKPDSSPAERSGETA